ncbi:hypothetical protein CYMTET_17222 [Cymbomonas tetramitiformis]|uniref:Uncharacterized protein n=1 Tax=Cymbomonas tetramitiformis TaxID=36881 RepID=A0AAE0L7J4_9CHLO|nr:hypothetical protein CYMTET_17222 [Cymbomonas tetramitiformis]
MGSAASTAKKSKPATPSSEPRAPKKSQLENSTNGTTKPDTPPVSRASGFVSFLQSPFRSSTPTASRSSTPLASSVSPLSSTSPRGKKMSPRSPRGRTTFAALLPTSVQKFSGLSPRTGRKYREEDELEVVELDDMDGISQPVTPQAAKPGTPDQALRDMMEEVDSNRAAESEDVERLLEQHLLQHMHTALDQRKQELTQRMSALGNVPKFAELDAEVIAAPARR